MNFWQIFIAFLSVPLCGAVDTDPTLRINLALRTQLEAIIQYHRDKQALTPISTWIDESHSACVGVGIEETLACEMGVLQTHCKSQKALPQSTCLSLADHYASLYMNRKAFSDWKSRDFQERGNLPSAQEFRLERLRNRFVALRRIIETISPPCKMPWTSECETDRIMHFCIEYSAETSFPWPACVSGILESWRN